jgi:hypothetical protein
MRTDERIKDVHMKNVARAYQGFVVQVVNPACLVGQPILAAAGFQPAVFTCTPAGFRQRRSRQGPSPARVNALIPRANHASPPLPHAVTHPTSLTKNRDPQN